jgi:transcriptional regulator with XRE-family HTH domain
MDVYPISRQIRERRKVLGLSLRDLANRADTSVATLSRYENGWSRFELRTLKKLAGALGCELSVAFVPRSHPAPRPAPREVVRRIGRLFWDHPLAAGDLTRHSQWVLERVLEYGALDDVRLLVRFLGRAAFLERVGRARFASERTARCWRQILEKEGRPCTRAYSRNTAWNS